MTPAEISVALCLAKTFDDETLAPLAEYRTTKRRTGCPTDLESEVIQAALTCQETADELRRLTQHVAREAAEVLAGLDAVGTKLNKTYYYLAGRENPALAGQRMQEQRTALCSLVASWAAIADRIVATTEEQEAVKKAARAALAAKWEKLPYAKIRDAVNALSPEKRAGTGLHSGSDKADRVRALAWLGIEPS